MSQKRVLRLGLILSLAFHLGFLLVASLSSFGEKPQPRFREFVSLVELPGGGGGGGGKPALKQGKVWELKKITEVKKQPKLVYPRKKKRRKHRYITRKKSAVVVRRKTSRSSRSSPGQEGEGAPTISFGGGAGPGGGGGGEMRLGNFPYPFFLITVREKIGFNWAQLMGGKKLGTEIWVYFKINRQGKIVEIKLEKPCGISRFDNYALQAVKDAEPFPRLPSTYSGDYLAIRVIFE